MKTKTKTATRQSPTVVGTKKKTPQERFDAAIERQLGAALDIATMAVYGGEMPTLREAQKFVNACNTINKLGPQVIPGWVQV